MPSKVRILPPAVLLFPNRWIFILSKINKNNIKGDKMGALTNSIENVVEKTAEIVLDTLPEKYQIYVNLLLFIVLISIYAIFVWQFYRFLAKRDILELNLKQYNTVEHAFTNKMLAIGLFIAEYIIILPIVVFFWFFVMAVVLLFLAQEQPTEIILLISGCIIGAIRISAYYSQELSKNLAQLLPLNFLAIALVTPGFFNVTGAGGIISKISSIDALFTNILVYLLIIMLIEFLLRMVWLVIYGFGK